MIQLEGRDTEYLTVYPSLDWDTQSTTSKEFQLDTFSDLEELFNSIAVVHTECIEERQKANPDQEKASKLGSDLVGIEIQLWDKLKSLTNYQFQEIKARLNTDYLEIIKQLQEWDKEKLSKSNSKVKHKHTFHKLFEDLTHKVNELEAFREQKILPDQLRILRATATGVKSKLSVEIKRLNKELEEERKSVDI